MTAIIAGLTVAVIWTIATIASARASREVGAPSALAGVMLVGLVATVPLLALAPAGPADPSPYVPWLLLAGGGNLVGLLLGYTALTRGNVSVAAPITATEGAIAATIAILAGEPVTGLLVAALTVVVVGVVLTAWGPEGDPRRVGRVGPCSSPWWSARRSCSASACTPWAMSASRCQGPGWSRRAASWVPCSWRCHSS